MLEHPAMQGEAADPDAAPLHHILERAVAQPIRHVSAHISQNHVTLEMAALEPDRHHSPDLNSSSDEASGSLNDQQTNGKPAPSKISCQAA